MKGILTGGLVAAIAVYLWGALFWGVNTLPFATLKSVEDQGRASAALIENFPQSGLYLLPDPRNDDAEALARLHQQGPIAIVQIDVDGAPVMSPRLMVTGFLHTLITMFLIGLLIRLAGPTLATYGDRVVFVLLAGVIVAFWTRLSDAIWWGTPLGWQIWNAVYDIGAWLVAALVLARFVSAGKTDASA